MKWFKYNWLMLVLIAAVVIMASVMIRQCNTVNEFTDDKKINDSLKTAMSNLNDEVNRVVEKLSEANHAFEIKIEQDQKERQLILNELSRLKNKHETLIIDTTKCCEQLAIVSEDFTSYISLSDSEIVKSNNIIASKDLIISNKDSINAQRLIFNQQLQSSLTTVTDNYDKLYKTNIAKDKKLKWFKVKESSLLVLLAASLVYSATK